MSSTTSKLCQSLQMVDHKTEYLIEAGIPSTCRKNIQINIANDMIQLSVMPKDGSEYEPIQQWEIEEGVHIEGMTTEYKNETLFIRLPKTDAQHSRPIQYTESIEITPVHESVDSMSSGNSCSQSGSPSGCSKSRTSESCE